MPSPSAIHSNVKTNLLELEKNSGQESNPMLEQRKGTSGKNRMEINYAEQK